MCGGNVTTSGKKTLTFKAKPQPVTSTTPQLTTTSPTTTPTLTFNGTATPTTKFNGTATPRLGDRFNIYVPRPEPQPDADKRAKVSKLNKANDFIEFMVTQSMVPSCRLLVYYVRKDGETVADSMVIDVEDKLENQV